jgi:pimeloyl-ACP methyl ester carboxylesterase
MTTERISTVLFIFALAASPLAAAPFIVPDVAYRCNADQVTGANYTINFVEFRDNGKPWCETELNDAIGQIREAREQNARTVVLVYIHGWKNNASEELSDDVTKFRKEVDRVSLILPRVATGRKPPLIGIYLAWRGLTLTVEPFKTLSYWDRRGVARLIGQTGIYDATARIVDEVTAARERTTLIFIGHSFGARVLENTADAAGQRPGFMAGHLVEMQRRLTARAHEALPGKPPLPPADMIIYVNAASSSAVARHTIKEWSAICRQGSDSAVCSAHPLWLAFTSTADHDTGIIMPVANAVFPAPSDHLHLFSAADSSDLHTHEVPEVPCREKQKPDDFRCPPGSKAQACFGTIRPDKKGSDEKICYEVRKIRAEDGVSPFWVMNVDGKLVDGHLDIWNEGVINMILSIMRQQEGTVNLLRDRIKQTEDAQQE